MEQIDLIELLLILRKRFWVISVITILCIGTSGLISFCVIKPEYKANTTLMIGRPDEYKKMEYADILLNQKLASTYSEIAKSRIVANEFMSNLRLRFTDEELDKKIEVTLVKDTEIVKISVTDKDGEVAAQIANEMASVFIKHIVRIMKIENIQVIDRAEVPLEPYKPKPAINMVIGSFLGIFLGIISMFAYEYFDNTVKTSDDIEKNLGLPIIGIIPNTALTKQYT